MIGRNLICLLAACTVWPTSATAQRSQEGTNSIGMKLVPIAEGEFKMGEGEAPPRTKDEWLARDEDEAPVHAVKISRSFLMGAHEVTNAQYEKFDPKHKERRKNIGAPKGDDDPVTYVTWQQAVDFCD